MHKQSKLANYSEAKLKYTQGKVFKHATWRKKVLQRDNEKCQYCSGTISDPFRNRKPLLEAHHIIARRHGGRNTLTNGITLCTFCHDYFDYMYSKYNLNYHEIMERNSEQRELNLVKNLMRKKYLNKLLAIINE